jgi:5-methylcytosine-specific restriction protein A
MKTERDRYNKYERSPDINKKYGRAWKRIRDRYAAAHPLCEMCLKEGYITPGVDVHHIRPVEQAKTVEGPDGMRSRCYDPNNVMLLCVEHHIKVHQDMRTHTKEKVKENKERARRRFLEMNDPHYKPENNQETMQQNKRLGIFGTLNYDKLKDMTMDERELAVTNHAKDVLSRKTMDGKGPQIPDDDYEPYDVTAEFTIMDCRYNKQGKIHATFKAQRTDEGLTIELTSFETVND